MKDLYIHNFFYSHVILWTLNTIVYNLDVFNLDHIPLMNSCSGHYTDQFLTESSSLSNMIKRQFSALGNEEGNTINVNYSYTIVHLEFSKLCSTIKNAFYIDPSKWLKILYCWYNNVLAIITACNIPEFFLYRAVYKSQMR